MSASSSIAAQSDGEVPVRQGSALVKGQRRRMEKHASPSNLLVRFSKQTTMLNPHAQLRLRLVDQGYNEAEVDRAMEEMWERDLPYDDYNEVLSFIRARNALKDSHVQHYPPEEETKTASTAESTSTSTPSTSTADDRQRTDGSADEGDETEDAIDLEGFVDDADAFHLTRQRKSGVHPLNMSSKLDLVADYENLADAAFALSEWVAKAADRDEVRRSARRC